jgi:hypothetical protein
MNYAALKTELQARGFDYLNDTRLGYFINAGRHELDMLELWPYRLTSTSGASPVTIGDLGTIEEVVDTANNYYTLDATERRSLRGNGTDLTLAGSPQYFYVDNGVVTTYPVGGTLSVRYYKRPADLSGSTDIPLAPTQYHLLIVDMAARWAYRDADNFQAIGALTPEIDRQTQTMRMDLLYTQSATTDFIRTGGSDLWPSMW